jgi:hypothetical protein
MEKARREGHEWTLAHPVRWVSPRGRGEYVWHVAREDKRDYGTYYKAACNGRIVGGNFGPKTWRDEPDPPRGNLCPRCAKIAGKE